MGRSKQFNEAEVLDKATLTFWKRGFQKTTVRDLEREMGINQFSIYATFKNKQGLYRRVLDNYQQQLNREFLSQLLHEDCTLNDVEEFLKDFALSIASGKIPNSCLMVNSLREINHFDPNIRRIVIRFFDDMKRHFLRALNNSVSSGASDDPHTLTDLEQKAEYLVGIAQSISLYSKIKSPAQIKSYIEFAVGLISK